MPKLVLLHDRVVGAVLIGDTGLDETCENLILNRIRVMGQDGRPLNLLDPEVDIEDFLD